MEIQKTLKLEISDAEWEVMRVIWTLGHATSQQLGDLLEAKNNWKLATIKTLLGRLVKKGALEAKRIGRAFDYYPLVAEQAAMDHATITLFHQLCQMRAGTTLSHLLDKIELSQADIEHLTVQLQEKRVTAPEKVACDCLPVTSEAHCD